MRVYCYAVVAVLFLAIAGNALATGVIGSGSASAAAGCTKDDEASTDDREVYHCNVWGPVEWGNSASYHLFQLDTEDDNVKKQLVNCNQKTVCGCNIKTATVHVDVPSVTGTYSPSRDGIAKVTNAKLVEGVSGSGCELKVYAGSISTDNLIGIFKDVQDPSAPTAPGQTASGAIDISLPLQRNTFVIDNTGCNSPRSCIKFSYDYTLLKGGDADQAICTSQGGDWLADAETNKCCGDLESQGIGGDFFSVVDRSNPNLGTAMCINTTVGWRWVKMEDRGTKVWEIKFEAGGQEYKNAYAMYADNGPVVCGPDFSAVLGDNAGPDPMLDETAKVPVVSQQTGMSYPTFGYACISVDSPTLGDPDATSYAVAVCHGSRTAPLLSVKPSNLQMHATGAKIMPVFDVDPYYCLTEGNWSKDLDGDQEACDAAGTPPADSTLTQPTMSWTGSMCCGDDLKEYYNDPAVLEMNVNNQPIFSKLYKGCWNATPVPFSVISGTKMNLNYFVNDVIPNDPVFGAGGFANHSVIAFNGSFQGCSLPPGNTMTNAHWCIIEKYCGAPTALGIPVISVDSFCRATELRTCKYQCEEARCLDGPMECSQDKTKVVQWQANANNNQGGYVDIQTCDGPCSAGKCTIGSYSLSGETTYEAKLMKPGSTGCAVVMLPPGGDTHLPPGGGTYLPSGGTKYWPQKPTKADKCWMIDKTSPTKDLIPKYSSNNKVCYPPSLIQKNVYKQKKADGKMQDSVEKCYDYVSLKPIVTTKGGTPSAGTIDDTTNGWAKFVKETLKCDCGYEMVTTKLEKSSTKPYSFTFKCRTKAAGATSCKPDVKLVRCEGATDKYTTTGACPAGVTEKLLGYVPIAAEPQTQVLREALVGGFDRMSTTAADYETQPVSRDFIANVFVKTSSPLTSKGGAALATLYRCVASTGDHFDSMSATCEGIAGAIKEETNILIWTEEPS